jgi:hypothetical protein
MPTNPSRSRSACLRRAAMNSKTRIATDESVESMPVPSARCIVSPSPPRFHARKGFREYSGCAKPRTLIVSAGLFSRAPKEPRAFERRPNSMATVEFQTALCCTCGGSATELLPLLVGPINRSKVVAQLEREGSGQNSGDELRMPSPEWITLGALYSAYVVIPRTTRSLLRSKSTGYRVSR